MTREVVDREIQRAFSAWSEYTDLTFIPQDYGKATFEISFPYGNHCDAMPFDGKGGWLGHANYPVYGGAIHFDADEDWSTGTSKGVNLYQLAVHEIGHALGLKHSKEKLSIMTPTYRAYNPNFKLEKDDIDGIQAIYGKKSSTLKPQDSNLCTDPKIDAIFQSNDDHVYVFKGNKYYKLTGKSVAHGYPKLISERWPGAPDDIDAAFEYINGKTYIFKGSKYWRFNRNQTDYGFLYDIRNSFPFAPDNLDAVMYSKKLDTVSFFKGSQIWELHARNWTFTQMNINNIPGWELLPNHLDAAFEDSNGVKYFFKNDLFYTTHDNNIPGNILRAFHTNVSWFDC